MMDIGWSELLLIGVVALIVVGPKDLPRMFHALGRFTAKARGMAREFQRAMDDAAKTSGLTEAAKDLKDLTSKKSLGIDALEGAAARFEKWDPTKSALATQGPATKALAEKKASDAAARSAAQAAKKSAREVAAEMADDLADESAAMATPVPIAKPAAKAAAKPTAKPRAAKPAPAAAPDKPKPVRRKKSDT
ncbi:MAG: Sec-independent protein translocase protein TatB [Paracoccaceae bacterium]